MTKTGQIMSTLRAQNLLNCDIVCLLCLSVLPVCIFKITASGQRWPRGLNSSSTTLHSWNMWNISKHLPCLRPLLTLLAQLVLQIYLQQDRRGSWLAHKEQRQVIGQGRQPKCKHGHGDGVCKHNWHIECIVHCVWVFCANVWIWGIQKCMKTKRY